MSKGPAKLRKPLTNRVVGHGVEQVEQLLAHPDNARIHTEQQQQALAGAIDDIGYIHPVIVNRVTGRILDGHLRVTLALRSGVDALPVDYVELDEADEAKALLMLDPIAAMAATDREKLDTLLRQVATDDERVQALMADIAEREGLEYGKPEPGQVNDEGGREDIADELREKWQVATGQVWRLDNHLLVCGDCTDLDTVLRVMQGDKARLAFTSPPYNNQRDYELEALDWQALARGFSACMFEILGKPGDAIVNLGLEYRDGRISPYWNEWLNHCEAIGHPLYGWYVWDKGSGFPGEWNGRLAPAHEWVFHFSNGRQSANKWIPTTGESEKRGASGKRFRQKDGTLKELTSPDKIGQAFKVPDSVIRITREMARGVHTQAHPAVFPVEFAAFAIQTWSDPGDIVYEPFSGSGTTLIACEQLGRRCRAVEISPAYVGVALERFYAATNKLPVLVSSAGTSGGDSLGR